MGVRGYDAASQHAAGQVKVFTVYRRCHKHQWLAHVRHFHLILFFFISFFISFFSHLSQGQ